MEESIRAITRALLEKIKNEQDYIFPEDLRNRNIPDFISDRIEIEMEKNLKDSLMIPDIEWADLNRTDVEGAWQNFIDTAAFGLRLPTAHAPGLFETAVEESLAILVEPRKNIPEILFGHEKTLTREQLEGRVNGITVCKHLVFSVLRYADKKNLNEITFEQCERIVVQVDEKLSGDYDVLKWAELLEPIFLLTENEADSDLFRLFFEEKGKHGLAQYFDRMNTPVSRELLTEVLSLTEIPEVEEERSIDLDQTTNSDPDEVVEDTFVEPEPRLFAESDLEEEDDESEASFNTMFAGGDSDKTMSLFEPEETHQPDEQIDEGEVEEVTVQPEVVEEEIPTHDIPQIDEADASLHERFFSTVTTEVREEEDGEELDGPSFNSMFLFDEEPSDSDLRDTQDDIYQKEFVQDDVTPDETPMFSIEEDPDDVPSEMGLQELQDEPYMEDPTQDEVSQTDPPMFIVEEEPNRDFVETDPPESVSEELTSDVPWYTDTDTDTDDDDQDEELDEDEETSVWQNFISEEQDDSVSESEEDETKELGFWQNIPVDGSEQTVSLTGWMGDDKKIFIDELFQGSESKYEEILTKIASMNSWSETARFIENEIFSQNSVDMFDEPAVDFTDRLHMYFIKFK